ncbi:MAG: Fic family protein [Oscillospiraceae bacterium]|nr:Fic family protein [Oscillospiraceae bacterium]
MRQNTGIYEQHLRDITKPLRLRPMGDFHFYTFTPRPLVDGNFFEMGDELSAMLTMTHRQLGVLEGMVKLIPDSKIIRDLIVLRECHYSRLIDYEGDGSFPEILKAISTGKDHVQNITNIVSAFEYSLENPVDPVALSRLCSIALHGHGSDINIRERESFISLGRVVTNFKEYNPTAPDKIPAALADIFAFLSDDDKTDILVKAALAHYQFEVIHPFESYNGIVGRILFAMILFAHGIRAAPFVGLSELLYFNKNNYFEMLRRTQRSGGYIALIKFFVGGICSSAQIASSEIERLVEIIAEDEAKIKANSPTKNILVVYHYFKRHLVSEVRPISDALGISFNTAAKAVADLSTMGILKKDGQRSRHRTFVYDRFLHTLYQP